MVEDLIFLLAWRCVRWKSPGKPPIVEKIFQETGIRAVVMNNRITNVFRKKIGFLYAKLKKVKKKSGGLGVKRIVNKWRDQIFAYI